MTDPLPWRDGTQAPAGADALAPLPRGSDAPLPGLSLPALPVAGDEAAVARWMETDAAAARRAFDPPSAVAARASAGSVDGAVEDPAEVRHGRAREAGPPRLLPPDDHPRPMWTIGPERPDSEQAGPAPGADAEGLEDPEQEWRHERREEDEFRSPFGPWRPGAHPVTRGRGLRPVTLLVLLALVVLIAAIALG